LFFLIPPTNFPPTWVEIFYRRDILSIRSYNENRLDSSCIRLKSLLDRSVTVSIKNLNGRNKGENIRTLKKKIPAVCYLDSMNLHNFSCHFESSLQKSSKTFSIWKKGSLLGKKKIFFLNFVSTCYSLMSTVNFAITLDCGWRKLVKFFDVFGTLKYFKFCKHFLYIF
jgi:hypothetical protein